MRDGDCWPDQIAGKTWWEIWPENARDGLRASFEQARDGQDATFRGGCATAKGQMRDWDVTITPVVAADGQITSIFAVSRDVTPQA